MNRSPVSSAGKLDMWLELGCSTAPWEEQTHGTLVLQGTRGVEHVALAEVNLYSAPISVGKDKLFSAELDSTSWRDFLVGTDEQVRLPFHVTAPWGMDFQPPADLTGKVVIREGVRGAVGVEIRVAPPAAFTRVAEEFARATALTIGRWWVTEDRDGAAVLFNPPMASTSPLKYAELQLRFIEEELVGFLRVDWPRTKLAGLLTGRGAARSSTFRFLIPHESATQTEQFFREELFPHLEQRPSGSLPIPAHGTITESDDLPRIVPERQT